MYVPVALLARFRVERRSMKRLGSPSRMGEIWGEHNIRVVTDEQGAVTGRSSGFFVGTLADFRAAERPRFGFEPPEFPTIQE